MKPDDETALLARTAAAIHMHGHMIWAVGSGECSVPGCQCGPELRPWAYTVGLCQAGRPELLTFGLPTEVAYGMINSVAATYLRGGVVPIGRDRELDWYGVPIRLIEVPTQCVEPTQSLIGQWYAYYSQFGPFTPPDVLQVVHADDNERFPWHADYDRASRFGQPVLQDSPDALRVDISPIWPQRRAESARRRRR